MKDGKALSQWLALLCLVLTWPLTPIQAEDAPATPDQQVAAGITVGKPQWLEAGGQRFLGIYTASTTGSSLGGAIILPCLGEHPNWPDVIAPLRKSLPNHGWDTLSIALPVPTKGSDGLWTLAPYFTAGSRVIALMMPGNMRNGFRTGFHKFEKTLTETDKKAMQAHSTDKVKPQ